MRRLLFLSLLAIGLLGASSARADCIGPYECFCTTSSTGPLAVVQVLIADRRDDQTTATVQVESVHGTAASPWRAGDQPTVVLWQPLEVGDRVLVEPDDAGSINTFNLVEERADGSLACSGFTSPDLTLSELITARLSESCYEALDGMNVTFESPPCNDVVEGSPFDCTSVPGPEGALWLGAVGLLFGVRRRRAPVIA